MDKKLENEALDYHKRSPQGKIEVKPTKPIDSQNDLSLAYTPGVAIPTLEIKKNKVKVWDYTARGNRVAILSDGTAVLGLGNIGPRAALPVMEGKAVLFKRFADVDAVPIVIQDVSTEGQPDVDKIVELTKSLDPTFGGINLEDIKAPQCFEIEKRLKNEMNIPVFHDDQHGTAIITLACLLNGLEIVGKNIHNVKITINGAGASALATAHYYISVGVKKKNLTICDSKGVIYKGRENINKYKAEFASDTDARNLSDAMVGADMFLGLSVGNVVSKEMVKSMADKAIVVAMANPYPEIMPDDALEAGAYIVATGRSDFPNQVNNVLGFPGLFRGALDVRATDVSEGMKLAASCALAGIAKERFPEHIKGFLKKAYPQEAKTGLFDKNNPLSKEYLIPKPLDPRVVPRVAAYVAEAAMKEGLARVDVDLDTYEQSVMKRIDEHF